MLFFLLGNSTAIDRAAECASLKARRFYVVLEILALIWSPVVAGMHVAFAFVVAIDSSLHSSSTSMWAGAKQRAGFDNLPGQRRLPFR